MDNMSQNKSFLNLPPILVVIFFFMPWLTFSCSGQPLGTFSGWQLATGNLGINQTSSGYQYNGDAKLFIIPLVGIVALVTVNIGRELPKLWYVGAGIVGILFQVYYYLDIQRQISDASNQGAIITVAYEIGWWLTVFALVAIIYLGWQHKPDTPTDGPPPNP